MSFCLDNDAHRIPSLNLQLSEGESQSIPQSVFFGGPRHGHVSTSHKTPQDRLLRRPLERPPRPLNCYMLFLQDLRNRNADSGVKLTTASAGAAWRELSPEDKAYYKRLAIQAKEEHAVRYPTYTLQPKKGSERRAYGSRKRSCEQARKLRTSTGSAAPLPATISPQFDQLSEPGEEQVQSMAPLDPSPRVGITTPPYSPEEYDTALGLFHVPYSPSQPPSISKDFSFSSTSNTLDHPSLPNQVPGFDYSPSASSFSSLVGLPPTPQSSFLAYHPNTDQQVDLSPLLHFDQLSLNDDPCAHTSTLISHSTPIEQTDMALGLSGVPYSTSRLHDIIRDSSIFSPSTTLDHPSFPNQVPGFENSPPVSSFSPPVCFPPIPQSTFLACHPNTSQPVDFSPLLRFDRLSLNDDPRTHTSTLMSHSAPVSQTVRLPQHPITEVSPYPGVFNLPPGSFSVAISSNFGDSTAPSYYDNLVG